MQNAKDYHHGEKAVETVAAFCKETPEVVVKNSGGCTPFSIENMVDTIVDFVIADDQVSYFQIYIH